MITRQGLPRTSIVVLVLGLVIPLVVLLSLHSKAETVPAFAFTVPPLIPEQPLLKSIRLWNSEIVVESEEYEEASERWISQYFAVDSKKGLSPLKIAGCNVIRSIAESAQDVFVFCSNGQHPVLLSTAKNTMFGWKTRELPTGLQVEDDSLITALNSHVALLSSDYLYWLTSNGGWSRMPFHHPSSVKIKVPPQHILLTNRGLFVGYDAGEFGGALIFIPIQPNSPNPLGPSQLLSSMNVNAIAQDRTGAVWVAGGLAHLGMKRADLVRIKEGTVETILHEESFGERSRTLSGSLQLPEPTDVSSLCLDPTDKPLILATDLGVLELDNKSFRYRIKADFSISYKMPDYSVGSRPVGMVCPGDGRILVATRSTGIMEFVNSAAGYNFRQLVFP